MRLRCTWNILCTALFVTAFARADETAKDKVPTTALQAMPKGAISLQSKTFKLSSGNVLLHLYTVPAGYAAEAQYMGLEKPTGPIKREDITTGPSLSPSRFWMDVFTQKGKQLKRLNSVPFIQSKDANNIQFRWLYPAKKQGPIILMHFGYTHWHERVLLAFPQGFSDPYTVQEFFWGNEGETSIVQRLHKTDNAGRLVIEEEDTDEGRTTKRLYQWDGVEWAQPHLPYFVIGASTKTKAQAETWIGRYKQGYARPSSHYKKLRRGYYIVLLNRFATLKEANAFAVGCRKEKIPCTVRRAF